MTILCESPVRTFGENPRLSSLCPQKWSPRNTPRPLERNCQAEVNNVEMRRAGQRARIPQKNIRTLRAGESQDAAKVAIVGEDAAAIDDEVRAAGCKGGNNLIV